MLGVELVSDRRSKAPAKAEILRVMDQMKGLCPFIITLMAVSISHDSCGLGR